MCSVNELSDTNICFECVSSHQYNFEGRYNIVKFIREIQAQGLYVSLRIGPFIEAEWKYGYDCIKHIFLCRYTFCYLKCSYILENTAVNFFM